MIALWSRSIFSSRRHATFLNQKCGTRNTKPPRMRCGSTGIRPGNGRRMRYSLVRRLLGNRNRHRCGSPIRCRIGRSEYGRSCRVCQTSRYLRRRGRLGWRKNRIAWYVGCVVSNGQNSSSREECQLLPQGVDARCPSALTVAERSSCRAFASIATVETTMAGSFRTTTARPVHRTGPVQGRRISGLSSCPSTSRTSIIQQAMLLGRGRHSSSPFAK